MKSILNHKTHLTAKVTVLAIILLVSIAMPLLTFTASAAGTVSISPSTGPNGTAVKVTGSGFGASETYTSFTILVDGLNTKTTLTGGGLSSSYTLATTSAGVLSGYFVIGGASGLNLLSGTHTVQISDATAAPPAVSFTIVAPTVTLAPASGPAGTSVIVTASGFPVGVTSSTLATIYSPPSQAVMGATFAGTTVPFASGTFSTLSGTLSSNSISTTTGSYKGTVSLPAITTGSAFTLTDNFGNVATTNWALNVPTVTLTPASGPVGTLVTATVTGFGPGASFSNVWIGNGATPTSISPLIPTTPMVTEQGTSAFQFVVSKAPLTGDFVSGSQMITVKDSLGDVASNAFTITANATVTLGSATVNSGVPFAPAGTGSVVTYLSVNGFKANALLTISSSPGVPAGWITYMPGGYPTVTTDATGSIVTPIVSATGTAPPSGVYSITISDGTNSVTLLLTITSSGNFFVISPNTGAQGTTVSLSGFLITPGSSGAINFDGSAVTTTMCTANTWPTPPTTMGMFTVPGSGTGPHTITTANIAGAATFTNTGAPAITMVTPSSAAVGTTVTIVGMGFANNAAQTAFASFTIDSITVPVTSASFTQGAMVASFVVPVFLPGTHIISATDGYFNTATASLTTTVSSVTLSVTSGVVAKSSGTSLSITGSNFPMNQAVSVSFTGITGNLAAATTGLRTTNTNGAILIYTTSIPNTLTVAGPHTVTITAGTASATATFTVMPTITLTGSAVKPGGTTVITGAGFAATSALSLAINGTAASWYNTAVTPATALTTAPSTDTSGSLPTGIGTVIASTTAPGAWNVSVTDASGNVAFFTLTVLGTPAIFLGATQTISGPSIANIDIQGTGFTPGTGRAASVNIWQGTTVIAAAVQTSSSVTVNSTGGIPLGQEQLIVPALTPGVYTVNLTLTLPTESAVATLTVLGAPTVTLSTNSAIVGANVTATVVGITAVNAATLGSTSLLVTPGTTFGPTAVLATGTNAYNLTTWFIVPSIPGGPYTVLFGDNVRSAFATFTVVPSITLSPTTGILKGTFVYITGTGFGTSGTSLNVTVNGALVTLAANTGTTGTGGTISTNFAVPLTTTSSNTVKVTDTLGNTATSTFAITPPTITLTPTSGPTGTTVEIIGNAFTPYSAIVVEVGTSIVNTVPATAGPNGAGAFLAFVNIPAGLSGNQTVTVIDSSNNMATAQFTVGGTSAGIVVDQTSLSSTAQTVNSAGQATNSFARGSTVKITFVLDSLSGSGNIVWRVTLQQGTAVYTISQTSASISTTPTTLSFAQLIPTTVSPGTWTASVQIFGSDGVTPLGVATLVFNVT